MSDNKTPTAILIKIIEFKYCTKSSLRNTAIPRKQNNYYMSVLTGLHKGLEPTTSCRPRSFPRDMILRNFNHAGKRYGSHNYGLNAILSSPARAPAERLSLKHLARSLIVMKVQ